MLGALDSRVSAKSTDADLVEYVGKNSMSVFRPVGAARIVAASKGVEEGVVDSALRVMGEGGIGVVDASVFPQIPAAHLVGVVGD